MINKIDKQNMEAHRLIYSAWLLYIVFFALLGYK